jgi:non-lysosomal glucosylceramidase
MNTTDSTSIATMGDELAPTGAPTPPVPASTSALPRRDFLRISSLTLAASALNALPVMAGPFDQSDFETLIPPDKKLRPEWVQSLFARGERTIYRKSRGELRPIGLPIGGICCGTLYLGGDGKLWLWDIFNRNQNGILPRQVPWDGFGDARSVDPQNGANYVAPADPESPLTQGFALHVDGVTRSLDARGWQEIEFSGEYPLGIVRYTDPASPVAVTLHAYSPFIPLNADDSGLPVTLSEFTIENTTAKPVDVEIGGWLQNAVSLYAARPGTGERVNTVRRANDVPPMSSGANAGGHTTGSTAVIAHFDRTAPQRVAARADIVVDDFEHADYGNWKVDGVAFGRGPVARENVPGYQGDLGGAGKRVVNSHATAPGGTVEDKDRQTGKLTSPPFKIERKYLTFYIGGGKNIEEVGLRLLVDGKTVRRAAGQDNNAMRHELFDVAEFSGKQAVIEIYDNATGPWGNIGVDDIVQTDEPHITVLLEQEGDWGEMALALLGAGIGKADVTEQTLFDPRQGPKEARKPASAQFHAEPLIGGLTKSMRLAPGKSQTVTFLIAWRFPNSGIGISDAKEGNYYAKRFADVGAIVDYVAREYPRLSRDTKLWHATWYDSTLPYWFLDRTFANTSILATSTAHRFGTGRFWGWEGVGCCFGTCTHVWHYAQAVGRIFPELERIVREHVDFGIAFDTATGLIRYRGEGSGPAVDGQCGRILGALREHQMSADDGFLRRIWPQVKEAIGFLMRYDKAGDGLLGGAQDNTLDAAWYGKIAWLSSLYAAALAACAEMGTAVGDADFARLCREKSRQTARAIESELYNGEYFIQRPEPGKEGVLGTYQTCHIDQVHGQSWAWQVDLGRILDREKTVSALKALYRYNFTPDVGPFRRKNRPGRPYALAGDGGLIMSSNPKELPHAFGNTADWQYGYFNECMSGFEHQAASHMIAEGMLLEGLAVTRAIHDRYHAGRRNPYNEIECSDHYSRAMASYGSFVNACGFTYHGPQGRLGFAPHLSPEQFRAAFTAAEGWGTYEQQIERGKLNAIIAPKWGQVRLTTWAFQMEPGPPKGVKVTLEGNAIPATMAHENGHLTVTLASPVVVKSGQKLKVTAA